MNSKSFFFSRKFWPIFWTQFWGALNDNMFKNAMVILITYKAYSLLGLGVDQMVAVCGGIFILPFFLFSSISGQLADKLPKNKMIIFTKALEVVIMSLGAVGYMTESVLILFVSLFLMGLQSTIFGPAKYSVLPELLDENHIVKGNALVEMGTFLAILIGTIIGGILISLNSGPLYISIAIIMTSVVGLLCSLKLQKLKAVGPELKIDFNLIRSTMEIVQISRKTRSVFISILGISWFWFFGAILLSIFPIYVKNTLNGDESVVTLFLALFSIGVAIGSVVCEKCSHERVELGLVPFGSIGMSLFVLHLFYIGTPYESSEVLNVMGFLQQAGTYWIVADLLGLSIMSGFFIVPLYTFIQMRSDRHERSRVIASNNILNALFMVVASILLMGLFAAGVSVTQIFLVLFVLNTLVSIYIYTVIPEFLWRFICVILGRIIYRLKITGLENIPNEGPAVLIANHVSFIDWLVVSASVKRPVRFVMHYSFMKNPLFAFLLRGAKVIPIAGQKEDPELLDQAFDAIAATLEDNEMVCIFPEGQITRDGKTNSFRPGIERIIKRNPVPVIPMAIKGLWGSFFSRKYGSALTKFSVIPKNIWGKVELQIVPAWAPEVVQASKLEAEIKMLLNESSGEE